MAIKIFTRSPTPDADYREGGPLDGFDADAITLAHDEDERAMELYNALGVARDDADYSIGLLTDGRWALVGLDVAGHRAAVEITPEQIAWELELSRRAARVRAGESQGRPAHVVFGDLLNRPAFKGGKEPS